GDQVRHLSSVLSRYSAPDDRVLLAGGNGVGWLTAFFGVVYCGRVACPVDSRHLLDAARQVRPSVIVCDGPLVASAIATATCAPRPATILLTPASDSLRLVIALGTPPQ